MKNKNKNKKFISYPRARIKPVSCKNTDWKDNLYSLSPYIAITILMGILLLAVNHFNYQTSKLKTRIAYLQQFPVQTNVINKQIELKPIKIRTNFTYTISLFGWDNNLIWKNNKCISFAKEGEEYIIKYLEDGHTNIFHAPKVPSIISENK
jgi:hypothetical protein